MGTAEQVKSGHNSLFKYVSLLTLTVQNAAMALTMRHARTQSGDMFLASTAVIVTEIIKLICCTIVIFLNEERSLSKAFSVVRQHTVGNCMDTLKVAVPSMIYYIQNNLLYVGVSHLDAATFQVTYQLKILTTAILSVIMLKKKLFSHQWISLVFLFGGVSLVQLLQINSGKMDNTATKQQPIIGLSAVIVACCLSGFAGVYFEKILKGSSVSVWIRNVQLSVIAIPFGLVGLLVSDFETVRDKGFFFGYNSLTWSIIMLQAMGGLLVAVVVKYSDNILKGFATSLAIIVSCVISIYLFDFQLSFQFVSGTSLVMVATFLYSYQRPAANATPLNKV
ncbi:SLC35A2 (predicted) [Pycnogonum litorale]